MPTKLSRSVGNRNQTATHINAVATQVVDTAYHLHQHLGPGLLESAYEKWLIYDLKLIGIRVKSQVGLPIVYKGLIVENSFKIDLLVDDCLVVELKAITELLPVHAAQTLTYLKCGNYRLGLLINFGGQHFAKCVKRIVNGL